MAAETDEKITKAQKTREHILGTALMLFSRDGYAETTMRDIAREAGCSLGLAYRYFARKEEMVLALYEQCTVELEEEVFTLPRGPLAKRFAAAMEADLRHKTLHRRRWGRCFRRDWPRTPRSRCWGTAWGTSETASGAFSGRWPWGRQMRRSPNRSTTWRRSFTPRTC